MCLILEIFTFYISFGVLVCQIGYLLPGLSRRFKPRVRILEKGFERDKSSLRSHFILKYAVSTLKFI